MSHYAIIQVKLADKAALCEALTEMGLKAGQYEQPVTLRDYTGTQTSNLAHVVVARETLQRASFSVGCADLGFFIDGEQSKITVDLYASRLGQMFDTVEKFTKTVNQEYAAAVISRKARAQGKTVQREKLKDGRLRVLVAA